MPKNFSTRYNFLTINKQMRIIYRNSYGFRIKIVTKCWFTKLNTCPLFLKSVIIKKSFGRNA